MRRPAYDRRRYERQSPIFGRKSELVAVRFEHLNDPGHLSSSDRRLQGGIQV